MISKRDDAPGPVISSSNSPWRPRLRRATTLVLLAAFTALITALFVAARILYTDGFIEAEQRDLLARARHAQAVLSQGFAMLTPAVADYAEWEATRAFVLGRRPNYTEYNWQAWTLQRFKADVVFVMDLDGRILLQRGLDPTRQSVTMPMASETAAVSPQGPLWPHLDLKHVHDGYVVIGGRPYMWAASPIHADPDPAAGWLILLRRLNAAFIRELDQTLDADARFETPRLSERVALPSVPLQRNELQLGTGHSDALRASFVVGMLPDGAPLRLALATDRPLLATVARISRYFFWASLCAGMVVTLLAVMWVQRRLLGPLDVISRRLQEIGVSNDLSARLPAIGDGDEITGVVTAANQLLEQIQAKREVELARDAAIEASRAKSEFLARMSHEIRTPMNGVLGMTELLSATALDSRQRQYAETIQYSATSLLGIINDTLDYSRIEAGKLTLEASAFDLAAVVDNAIELLAERAAAKGLELLCDLPSLRSMRFIGDGMRLRQVLVNLLGNAVKFTEQGEVLVRVTVDSQPDTVGAAIRCEVTDTGIGIRPENQALVFESFSQEDGTTTRKYGGTGLGLAICQQLITLMGGQIGVRSVPGQGSTFWFSLSLPQDKSVDGAVPPANLPGQRIMLVLANNAARQLLRRQFEALQAEVEDVDSAEAALLQLHAGAEAGRAFDAVLVDFALPDGNGLDFVERVRANSRLCDCAVALLANISTQLPEERWRKAGAIACLTKPLRRSALIQYIEALRYAGSASTPPAHDAAADRPSTDDLLGLRVLLVEDNPVNQEVARGLLWQLGCRVTLAADGRQGVRAVETDRFDAVLMDCHMPELDGYMAAAEIRQWEAKHGTDRTIIIALTANALEGDREKCLVAGMDDYLSKPFTAEQLRTLLLRYRPQVRPALNAAAIAQLRALQKPDAPSLLHKVIDLYFDSSRQLIERLRQSLDTQDRKGLRDAAHSLKSSSANVGAARLAELAKNVEASALSGDLAMVASAVDALLAEHRGVIEALQQERRCA